MGKSSSTVVRLSRWRQWSTPLSMGVLVLMSGTGILMFFEQESLGIITVTHQWFSWLFLFGIGTHVAANLNSFKKHLKSNIVRLNVLAFTLIFVASLSSWGMITGPQLERPIELALVYAPISALADVVQVEQDALIERFRINGIEATGQHSISDIAEEYQIDENELLAVIFLDKNI